MEMDQDRTQPELNMIPAPDLAGHTVKLTSAELSQIWAAYQNDTLAVCVLKYFMGYIKDKDIRSVAAYALQISEGHVKHLTNVFRDEGMPVPYGFKEEEDVDLAAPALFSETYILSYMRQMGELGINATSVAVALSARMEIFDYFTQCMNEYTILLKKATQVLQAKGLYIRPPNIPMPDKVDFVNKQSFLTGWMGNRRPLLSLEITNLFNNIQRNALGAATLMGFSQVAKSSAVRKYLMRGKDIASKHVEIFGSILREDDLPVPMTWDAEVTDATTPPFSDKLMMFNTTALIAIGMGYYGASISTSLRRDISAHYVRLTSEIAKYSEDGANLMIENGWMEQPPQALDRDKLMKH